MTRNLTTYVENEVQVWTPGPGGSAGTHTLHTPHTTHHTPHATQQAHSSGRRVRLLSRARCCPSVKKIPTYVISAPVVWSDAMATFDLTVELRYVEEAVRYRPAFWELIKNAWVQVTAHTSPSVSRLLSAFASTADYLQPFD